MEPVQERPVQMKFWAWLMMTVMIALAFVGAWTVGVWLAGGSI